MLKIPSREALEKVGPEVVEMIEATQGLGPPEPDTLMDCGDGEVKPILTYPSPRLRDVSSEIEDFDESVRKLVADLTTTMYAAGGVGLAAPQIGEADRVFVIDILNGVPPQKGRPTNQLLVAVNPQVWAVPGKTRKDAERCLSFPDVVEVVERPVSVILKAWNHRGEPYALGCSADLARAVQHENDHLDGRLLIDHMPKKKARDLKRLIIAKGRRRRR